MQLRLEMILPATPERVFAAFVEAERFRRWWGPARFTVIGLEFHAAKGADYCMTMQPPEGEAFRIRGTFREVEAPRRLAYTFAYEPPGPDDQETLVTLKLESAQKGTRLVLDQGAFRTSERRALHRAGWSEALARLEQSLT
jgi:uncharacterized protein YndB with AHSA1/START domain